MAAAAENAALDKLYKASTTLVGVAAKLNKEGVDEFAEVCATCLRVFLNARSLQSRRAFCPCTAPRSSYDVWSEQFAGSPLSLMPRDERYLQNASEFQAMLESSKAGPKCKQLALSELPKYVGRYPDLAGDFV